MHRTHLEIFPTYYPPVFGDWFMDVRKEELPSALDFAAITSDCLSLTLRAPHPTMHRTG